VIPSVVSAFWLLLMESHLWPFTGVLSETGREVTRKSETTAHDADFTDSVGTKSEENEGGDSGPASNNISAPPVVCYFIGCSNHGSVEPRHYFTSLNLCPST
jgi:hypothetical protein